MTVLSWPAGLTRQPATFEFWLQSNSQVFQSPLDGSVQTLELPGARWMCAINMPPTEGANTALLESMLAKLRGQAGRIALWNMAKPAPRGSITGSPVVNGNQAAAAALNIKSAPVGSTLLEGDYIGVNGELRMVVADVTADGGGLMAVTLDSPLRNAVSDAQAVTLIKPTATFMLTSSEMPHAPKQPGPRGPIANFSMQFQETF